MKGAKNILMDINSPLCCVVWGVIIIPLLYSGIIAPYNTVCFYSFYTVFTIFVII